MIFQTFKNKNIVFLIPEVTGYWIPLFKTLRDLYGIKVYVYYFIIGSYILPDEKNIVFSKYPKFNNIQDAVSQIEQKMPELIYIAGWTNNNYLTIAKRLKKNGIPIVSGIDTQWRGTLRQFIAILISRFTIKRIISHMWVPGIYQYEYVRKLGYKKANIIHNVLCADVDLFQSNFNIKSIQLSKKFHFVGRFEDVKGLDVLIKAWSNISDYKGWKLVLIGDGSLKNKLKEQNIPNLIIKNFMSPLALSIEIKDSGCFVLPSRYEPWGLVIHEFACSGKPIICSNVVGAASTFLINGYNGFVFKNENTNDLTNKLNHIINSSKLQLEEYAKNSYALSSRITPKIVASSLMSILQE